MFWVRSSWTTFSNKLTFQIDIWQRSQKMNRKYPLICPAVGRFQYNEPSSPAHRSTNSEQLRIVKINLYYIDTESFTNSNCPCSVDQSTNLRQLLIVMTNTINRTLLLFQFLFCLTHLDWGWQQFYLGRLRTLAQLVGVAHHRSNNTIPKLSKLLTDGCIYRDRWRSNSF